MSLSGRGEVRVPQSGWSSAATHWERIAAGAMLGLPEESAIPSRISADAVLSGLVSFSIEVASEPRRRARRAPDSAQVSVSEQRFPGQAGGPEKA